MASNHSGWAWAPHPRPAETPDHWSRTPKAMHVTCCGPALSAYREKSVVYGPKSLGMGLSNPSQASTGPRSLVKTPKSHACYLLWAGSAGLQGEIGGIWTQITRDGLEQPLPGQHRPQITGQDPQKPCLLPAVGRLWTQITRDGLEQPILGQQRPQNTGQDPQKPCMNLHKAGTGQPCALSQVNGVV